MLRASKPRILFVAANTFFVRLFLRDAIRMLVAEGHPVLVVCAPETGPQTLEHELGCKVHSLDLARSIDLGRDLRSLLALCRIVHRWQPALVHTHTPKAGLLGALAAWCGRVPVRIHTVHGLRSETLTGLRLAVVEAMERLTSAASTHCLAVSCSLRDQVLRRRLCSAAKLRVLGAGSAAGVSLRAFDPALCEPHRTGFRLFHSFGADELLIGYIGRIATDKGVAVLEAAWQTLRDDLPHVRLLIAGPPDPGDPCDAAVLNRLRDDERVIFQDCLIAEPARLLAACDVFVQPSFREGLGVAALEAAALEVPIVASRVTGLVDAVQHGQTGVLVEPRDAGALATALRTLLADAGLRRSLGKQGRRFVETRFDRRRVLADLMTFYRQLLSARPAARAPLKRCFDVAVAATLLVVLTPVLAVVALALLFTLGHPVLFRQQRVGRGDQVFTLVKFRTMVPPAPGQPMLGTDSARTPQLGTWLRKLSLDELPQLWNVLRGEMSLVGPRPLLVEYLPRYSRQQRRRHEVRPGITGWAQVHGRNDLGWHERFDKDVWYVEHRSFRLDLLILLKTAGKLLKPEGVVPSGQPAMTEFLGSQSATRSQL